MPDPNLTGDNTPPSNEDVDLTDDELSLLDEDTLKKVKSLSAQKRHWRKKAEIAEEKIKNFPSTSPAPSAAPVPPVSAPAPQVDVEKAARKAAMDLKREEHLATLPEDKRGTIKEVFDSLTSGKEVTLGNFNSYMTMAMRAAGVEPKSSFSHHITSAANGAVPPVSKPGPTKEQVEMAQKAGIDPNKVYGEKADFSNMLNAHKFVDQKSNEVI